jgi:hypothetical protein
MGCAKLASHIQSILCTRPCRADHITFEDVKAEYATGKSFVHEHLDTFGRPVLIIRAKKHNPSKCRGWRCNTSTSASTKQLRLAVVCKMSAQLNPRPLQDAEI